MMEIDILAGLTWRLGSPHVQEVGISKLFFPQEKRSLVLLFVFPYHFESLSHLKTFTFLSTLESHIFQPKHWTLSSTQPTRSNQSISHNVISTNHNRPQCSVRSPPTTTHRHAISRHRNRTSNLSCHYSSHR